MDPAQCNLGKSENYNDSQDCKDFVILDEFQDIVSGNLHLLKPVIQLFYIILESLMILGDSLYT